MEKSSKIYIAGHRGMVGSSILRALKAKGFSDFLLKTSAELDLRNQQAVNDFFEKGRWKTFVLFSIIKYVDLVNLSTSYRVRYADITEKYEERDNKIEEILK